MNWTKVRDEVEERKRILVVAGTIDNEQNVRLKKGILRHNLISETEPIKVLIDSSGGDLVAALETYDMFNMSKAPITGVVAGDCMSAATVILQACNRRVSLRHSSFLVHYPTLRLNLCFEDGWEKTLELYLESGKKMRERIERIYLTRTKMPPSEISEALLRGNKHYEVIDADRALSLGIVDDIVDKYDLFGAEKAQDEPKQS